MKSQRRSMRRGLWIESLHLTRVDRRNIARDTDVDDRIIHASLKLLQRQYPLLYVQAPSVHTTMGGFDYCPHETVQIVHNGANHWILLSSLAGNIVVFDSLNTRPTQVLIKQISQLFSADRRTPPFRQVVCHKQLGSTDCGLFAIAYSIDLLCGVRPNDVIYDQSKMRKHLIGCLEVGVILPFPKNACRAVFTSKPFGQHGNNRFSWMERRRSKRMRKRQVMTSQATSSRVTSQTNGSSDFLSQQSNNTNEAIDDTVNEDDIIGNDFDQNVQIQSRRSRMFCKSVVGVLKTLAVYSFPRRKDLSQQRDVNFQ